MVIPLYNYGHFLGECIESIVSQEGVDVDVLIVDDASTDDSLSVAQSIAAYDPRVTVVSNERNMGMVGSINRGLWSVEGEYVVKFDADDILTPGALARATALLDADPSVGFVYGFPVEFTDGPPPPARTTVRNWTVWSGLDWVRIRCRKGRNCIMQPEVVMRASVLHETGKYRAEMGHAPDFDMWLRLATTANVGRINGAHQGYYRIHPQSWQRTMDTFRLKDLEVIRKIFAGLFDEAGTKFADRVALRTTAQRAVAINAINEACRAYDEGRAEREPVDDYVALALDLYPDAASLPQWRSLQRRRRAGPERAPQIPAARLKRGLREVEDRLRWRRWRWSGV